MVISRHTYQRGITTKGPKRKDDEAFVRLRSAGIGDARVRGGRSGNQDPQFEAHGALWVDGSAGCGNRALCLCVCAARHELVIETDIRSPLGMTAKTGSQGRHHVTRINCVLALFVPKRLMRFVPHEDHRRRVAGLPPDFGRDLVIIGAADEPSSARRTYTSTAMSMTRPGGCLFGHWRSASSGCPIPGCSDDASNMRVDR